MRVLVACEYSGVVREAFAAYGHDAWSCDVLPTAQPGKHIQADVRSVLGDGWDLMIAHPPCTYLSYAGMRWWHAPGRAEKRQAAVDFFMELFHAPIPAVCVENPRSYIGQVFRAPDQVIEPFQFGDNYRKRTCLWLRGLSPLLWFDAPNLFDMPVAASVPGPVYVDGSGKRRHWVDALRNPLARSVTSKCVAAAMAAQWGNTGGV